MDLKGARVLVIGGAGFIGSFVVEALLESDVAEVIIFDNFTRGTRENIEASLKDPRCRLYENGGDIRDLDLLSHAMTGVDGVIHLAAMWLLHCNDFPRTAFHVNVEGTFNVLEACQRHGVKRLVYSSSASVYGNAVQVPMTEEHPFNNRNFYGATKIAGEAMCRAFHERYGLSYVGLRYMNAYGPRQDQRGAYSGVIPAIFNAIDDATAPSINGDGSQAYDFIHVRDIAHCNVLALSASVDDEFFNVGTGKKTSISELTSMLLSVCGSDLKPVFRQYDAEDVRGNVTLRVCDPVRAREKLQFEAAILLQDGLRDLRDWRNRIRKQ